MIEERPRRIVSALRIIATVSIMTVVAACGHSNKEGSHAKLLASEVTSDIGVNAYLWRATLETLDFMPIASTDSKGGVVVTDWYTNPATPAERVKVTVTILDKRLRADALRVAVARQWLKGGIWIDQGDKYDSAGKLQNAILTEARQIRLSQVHE